MKAFLLLFLLPLALCAQESGHKSPEEIQQELNDAEAQFEKAKLMFNPWYAGPLVTPSASMMPPGHANIQPYVFVTGNYAMFNEDRKSISIPHNSYQLKGVIPMQVGVTDATDVAVTFSAAENWKDHHSGGGFGDIGVTYGFLIQREGLYVPKFKFTISETFPTGRYKNLNPDGLDSSGGGSWQTQFGFAAGKVIWWTYPYPMNTRLFISYNIETVVQVSGFNTYGGGFGCKGRVRPGNSLIVDFGYEFSLSQPWVLAIDVVYQAQNSTKFHGFPGTLPDGSLATVGGGFNDILSLAPAVEYNFNDHFEILAGVQFSVYGRNNLNFVNGQLSVEYNW